VGGYADWRRAQDFQANAQRDETKTAARERKVDAVQPAGRVASAPKLSFKEKRELAELPDKIATLESEQGAITGQLEDAALYRSDPAQAQRLQKKLAQIGIDLAGCLARWEELESRANAAEPPLK
jgi:ATP-binding cassette subfamily F protein uup